MPAPSPLVPLTAAVQNYAWGLDGGAGSIVARMHAHNSAATINARLPYAELWIGTHPSAPALVDGVPLDRYLGAAVPYLLKCLSVSKPLSIQAHPDKDRAAVLHAANPAAYKDDNHKPEMCVALTEFEGMCNFRLLPDVAESIKSIPEFGCLCGGPTAAEGLLVAKTDDDCRAALRSVFAAIMEAKDDDVKSALDKVIKRLKAAAVRTPQDDLFMRLAGYYPGDVGCFAAYLLNHVCIKPGQAFFMAANEPHAYLKGQCVEIMACSDNVVRAGLTPKFKDVDTLVDMLTYQAGPPKIMEGDAVDKYSTLYQPPAEEFQLTKIAIPAGTTYELPPAAGPGILMVMDGSGWIGLASELAAGEEKLDCRMPVSMGSIYFVDDSKSVVVQAEPSAVSGASAPDLFIFRAGTNQSFSA